jgi:hypothetical protein
MIYLIHPFIFSRSLSSFLASASFAPKKLTNAYWTNINVDIANIQVIKQLINFVMFNPLSLFGKYAVNVF